MVMFDKGLSSNSIPPAGKGYDTGNSDLNNILSVLREEIQIGRVTDIILNSNYPNIEEYGGLNGIGTIFFELNTFKPVGGNAIAKPFFPQISSYPLVDELVLLFKLPNNKIGNIPSNEVYYYINMFSVWNHPHHNAYPNLNGQGKNLPPQQQKTYQQTEVGSTRKTGGVNDDTTETISPKFNSPINPSQATFEERSNIHPLLPFAGDVIYQGRWGNSIRFGSTAKPTLTDSLNEWSETGTNGDPITIIRNGQSPEESNEGWVPITENINTDISSIWQTSTQKIPIETINNEFTSYNESPELPNLYEKPQVIINSDRLVFNAKTDHVLISGEKSVFLGANSSLNFNAGKNVVVECSDIKLGDKSATEPLILGDTFLKNLDVVLTKLDHLCTQLSVDQIWPAGAPVANGGVITVATSLKLDIANFKANMGSYKSQVSKTK